MYATLDDANASSNDSQHPSISGHSRVLRVSWGSRFPDTVIRNLKAKINYLGSRTTRHGIVIQHFGRDLEHVGIALPLRGDTNDELR